jgi:hypothetical protein
MANASGNSSMSGMFSGLLREVGGLVRAEINLATTEMTGKAFRVGKEVGLVAAGGALAYAGGLSIVAACVRLLETFLPRWLAALVVGLAATAGGATLIKKGLADLKETDLAPERTIETLKTMAD